MSIQQIFNSSKAAVDRQKQLKWFIKFTKAQKLKPVASNNNFALPYCLTITRIYNKKNKKGFKNGRQLSS